MTGDRSFCVIVSCPYDARWGCAPFNIGATFTRPEMLEMALDGTLPSGTYWHNKGREYLFYQGVRYTLTDGGDVDEDSAVLAVKDDSTGYKLRWVAV